MQSYAVDRARVYVAGLSAGGAAAAIMAFTYPDMFAAVGVHSGLACGAAQDMGSAFMAMNMGAGEPVEARRPVPAIVFHGDRDTTVNAANAARVVAQMLGGRGASVVRTDGQRGGMRYTRHVHLDAAGAVLAEDWRVHGGGHAWFGGSPAGSYSVSEGPDATGEMLRFFLAHHLPRV
jgi:poly(3-hydroxybutyrate) depolymerase